MLFFSGNSLRGRLLRLLSIAIVLAIGIQAGLVYRMTRSEADEIFDYHMKQVAFSLQEGFASADPLQSQMAAPENDDFNFVIQVWSTDGARLFQSSHGMDLPLAPDRGFSKATVRDVHFRVFTARTSTRIIKVAQAVEARRKLAADMALRTAAPILLLAPVMLAVAWMVVRRSTRPILEVRDQVSRRASEDYSPLPSENLPEEVKPLVDEINLLFIRLGQSFEAQRAFVADAAHELRTPLAALRLQTQVLQRAEDDEARVIAARRLLGGIDRATRLVEQLLVLARQESAQDPSKGRELVDLATVSGLAISDSLGHARAKRIDIGMEGKRGIHVEGNAESLRILVRNLLENAAKFTPENGIIDVVLRTEEDRAVVVVEDSGPGIPPEEQARVFDRFYRLPGQAESGSGLGLAIVKAIVQRHQGEVMLARSARLGGLQVTIHLPLAQTIP